MKRFAKIVATALGAGYSPIAPGTCGTLVAIPIAWALSGTPLWVFVAATIAITGVAIAAADIADRAWGSHDDQRIVIDEVAGYLVTVLPVDCSAWTSLAAGFVVFRALDIVKPPPIRWVDEHLPGGWGVVLDDVAAGVMGAIIMGLLGYFGALPTRGGL